MPAVSSVIAVFPGCGWPTYPAVGIGSNVNMIGAEKDVDRKVSGPRYTLTIATAPYAGRGEHADLKGRGP